MPPGRFMLTVALCIGIPRDKSQEAGDKSKTCFHLASGSLTLLSSRLGGTRIPKKVTIQVFACLGNLDSWLLKPQPGRTIPDAMKHQAPWRISEWKIKVGVKIRMTAAPESSRIEKEQALWSKNPRRGNALVDEPLNMIGPDVEKGRKKSGTACRECDGLGYRRVMKDGYEVIRKCRCRAIKEVELAKERANIPNKFRNMTLNANATDGREIFRPFGGPPGNKDHVALASQVEAQRICKKIRDLYINAFIHKKKVEDLYGLLLHGECGRGKTRLACSLLCDLIHEGLYDVRFIEYNELFKQIRFSFNSKEWSYERIFQDLIRAKVLVIDDFATEVSGNLIWVLDNIGYIINERYAKDRPTVLTSNYWSSIVGEKEESASRNPYESTPSWNLNKAHKEQEAENQRQKFHEELKARVNYRLRSRIREMCYELKVEGKDYRNWIGQMRDTRLEERRKSLKENGGKSGE